MTVPLDAAASAALLDGFATESALLTPSVVPGGKSRWRPGPRWPGGGQGVTSRLVEWIRLIMVALGAVGGWEVASSTARNASGILVTAILLGSGVGYVVGGVFGRSTAVAVSDLEGELTRMPAADLLAGGVGLVVGLVIAALISLPLFHLPTVTAYSTVAFAYASFGYAGYKVGCAKSEELFALFGVKPKAAGHRTGDICVVDTSALLDGRLRALVRLGYLGGTFLLTRGVLEEVQAVADSSSPGRRARGRRALELLVSLKRDPAVDVVLVSEEGASEEPTDSRLVRLAKDRGAVLVTNDSNLGKLAATVDVPVRSIHALADAMRPPVLVGDRLQLRLLRPGRESGQAIGYLEDGTMMVVEEAAELLGKTMEVSVTNAIQTPTGQLVFGRLAGETDQAVEGD